MTERRAITEDNLDCISVANMRESDRLTIERFCSGRTLMYRAALGVFRAADWAGRTVIAVGGGNNGGDGYALACILARHGHPPGWGFPWSPTLRAPLRAAIPS